MPTYVYGCSDPTHPREELFHHIAAEVIIHCAVCGEVLHRVPQRVGHSVPPMDAGLRRTIEVHNYNLEKYRKNKARREANECEQRKAAEATARRQ